ncbi:MAG: sigma-70 family RNA polymerase sigma factor [Planctomycetota bacterium]
MTITTAQPVGLLAVAEELGPVLRRYARSLIHDAEAARDVVQDVVLRCAQRNGTPVNNAKAFLFTAVRRRCVDVLRKESRMHVLTDERAEGLRTDATPAGIAEARESGIAALAALETLPPAQREVLRLKFAADLSYAEIADVTGKTANNVGVLIHTGLKNLRQKLNAIGVDHA